MKVTGEDARLTPDKQRLLEVLLEKESPLAPKAPLALRRNPKATLPLSFAQERLWFLQQLQPDNASYNVAKAIRIDGRLKVGVLERAIHEMIRHHQILRVSCTSMEGRPVQSIAVHEPSPMPVIPVAGTTREVRESEAERLILEEGRRPLDLSKAPLLRYALLRLGDQEHVLLLTTHHFAVDGWAAQRLLRDLTSVYEAFRDGLESPLPESGIQYADYAAWQRECLDRGLVEDEHAYWKRQLRGAPSLTELATKAARPQVASGDGKRFWFEFPAGVADGVRALSRDEGVTVFTTLLCAFQVLICRHTGQEDTVIGTAVSSRDRIQLEDLMGSFNNSLVLRTILSGGPTFLEALARTRNTVVDALAHQQLPFEKLVELLQPERSLRHNPLYQIVFVVHDQSLFDRERVGELTLNLLRNDLGKARFDLLLETRGWKSAEPLAYIEYNSVLYDSELIEDLARQFVTLLEGIIADRTQPIANLPLIAEAECRRLSAERSHPPTDYPRNASIHEVFEAFAKQTPDATAIVYDEATLSYGELNRRANQLAHHLVQRGVQPGSLVGVHLERTPELITALLAVLKAGGAYLPLDPAYPTERLRFMLEDAGVSLLLSDSALADALPRSCGDVLGLDAARSSQEPDRSDNLETRVSAHDLAYVMYTSGTSGRPNGVEICHRGVTRLVVGTDYVELDSQTATL